MFKDSNLLKDIMRGGKGNALAAPIVVLMIIAMMILPIPPLALDFFFTMNIALALMVLIATVYTKRPLDFAAFPTILLVTTLLRLSLNVASTRVVLVEGHTGPDAAGKVIEAFGNFLVGGNLTVGIIIFAILVIINFVVITKGAGRIAEVSARFTLDAMPGKQMAIDADLNAGLINEAEAKKRRKETAQEAEFFGSMDGASKFVKGDAIAGILILFINIIGGVIIGTVQHGQSFGEALDSYLLLSVGDGLVAQVPSLIISIAAGLIVARVGEEKDMGDQVKDQIASSPKVLALSGAIIASMGLIPGMPNLAFLFFAGCLFWGAFVLHKNQEYMDGSSVSNDDLARDYASDDKEPEWTDIKPVDAICLEMGYGLIPMIEESMGQPLLKSIKGMRSRFAQEYGFLLPSVAVKDNLEIGKFDYRILIKGVCVASWNVRPDKMLAITYGGTIPIDGERTVEPAFDTPSVWISPEDKIAAQGMNYTVVEPSNVVGTHLEQIIMRYASDLLGRAETQMMLDNFSKQVPKIVEELVPKMVSLSTVQRVLQCLLAEGIPLRDLGTILESMLEHSGKTTDPLELLAYVRIALSKSIVQSIAGMSDDLNVMVLDMKIEQMMVSAQKSRTGETLDVEPNMANTVCMKLAEEAERQLNLNMTPCLLVPDKIRLAVAKEMKRSAPHLRVIAATEVPDTKNLQVVAIVGTNGSKTHFDDELAA